MFSKKLQNLHPYVPGEQLPACNYIKLNANENPYPPAPAVSEILSAFIKDKAASMSLYPDPESADLCKALARMLNESGGILNASAKLPFNVTEDMIFCGNGSDEVLSFIFYSFFDADAPLILPRYTYSFYPVYGEYYGIPLKRIPLKPDWSVDVPTVISALKEPCSGFICANPNAPTGIALTNEDIEAVLKNARGRAVVIDEAYADFGNTTALSLLDRYDNLIIVRTFSKAFCFAGMRLGFCIARPEAVSALKKAKNSFNHFPVDVLTQCAGSAVCKNWSYYADKASRIAADRDIFKNELEKAGWTVLPSQTNFVMVKKGKPEAPAEFSGAFVYKQLKERGFLVRYFEGPDTGDFVRITVGTGEQMRLLADIMLKM
ncbi:histidinol-phosphate transaminase [Treponema sp. OMZ 840]|uniref:pyridoxal phosphate-dependent aminotransferase n=1 Tax=Treponema sp. OMZ 840 TaxID=244313 RepID=UPI003D936467